MLLPKHRACLDLRPQVAIPPPIDLRNISLVCVETRRTAFAIQAIERCLLQADFHECLLLSPQAESLPSSIRHVPIRPLSGIEDYSRFMLHELGEHFNGAFALVVQWDGFITDASQWDPRFLDFDYVGAPWPNHSHLVGNGGFSLRSRRLVDALRELDIEDCHPEDHRICIDHRATLEREYGITFAPPGLAARFSFEHGEPTGPTFGQHGFFNFHRAMSESELITCLERCDDRLLQSETGRRLLKNLYLSGMRTAAKHLLTRRKRGPWKMRLDAFRLQAKAIIKGHA